MGTLTPARKDMTIIICYNIPPDRKWGWMAVGGNWVGWWRHFWKRWSWDFEDFEKTVKLSFYCWSSQLGFSDLKIRSLCVSTGRDLKHYKMRCDGGGGQFRLLWFESLPSCCQGLKVEKNKYVRTANICIITIVIGIFMAIQEVDLEYVW